MGEGKNSYAVVESVDPDLPSDSQGGQLTWDLNEFTQAELDDIADNQSLPEDVETYTWAMVEIETPVGATDNSELYVTSDMFDDNETLLEFGNETSVFYVGLGYRDYDEDSNEWSFSSFEREKVETFTFMWIDEAGDTILEQELTITATGTPSGNE